MSKVPAPSIIMSSKLFCIFLVVCLTLTIFRGLTIRSTSWQTFALSLPDISLYLNKPRGEHNLRSTNNTRKEVYVTKSYPYPDAVINTNATTSKEWCDSCLNYHQYNALIYPKNIPDTYLDMVMFIPSQHGDTSFQRRQFLRKFILNSTKFPQIKSRHVFMFGKFFSS